MERTGIEPVPGWNGRDVGGTLAVVPPVSFFFPDRRLSLSEDAAASLVAELQNRSDSSQTAGSLAGRIETEAHRGRLAAPGQDLELNYEERRELLEALKATTEAWPEQDKNALRELQLALTFHLSQQESDQT
jgi:hypothetical protein